MLEQKKTLNLFPKFDYGKGKGKFTNSDEAKIVSNYYEIDMLKEFKTFHQYSIEFEPQLPEDASKISDKLIESIRKELKEKVGLICYKGRMLWGNLSIKLALITKTTIQIKGQKQQYEVIIKPATSVTIQDFITKDQDNLARLSQILNVNTKNVLKGIGFKQLDRGNYYSDKDFESNPIKDAGLSIWRGYQVNLVAVANKLYMRVDVCSRVLRLESFLETLKKTKKLQDKAYINEVFRQSSVITRYGSHRIHRIEGIEYEMTPRSTFINHKSQQKQTFIDYYRTKYQCTINDPNQPLIKIIVKNCQEEEVHYLIPELVCLTGLTDQQRADFFVMKAVAQYTKLRVDERVTETNRLVRMLNKDGAKQLMFKVDQKAHQFDGNLIGAPRIHLGRNKHIQPNKGQMALRDTLLDPIHLKNYYFVYTTRGDRDEDDVDATFNSLQKASKAYGIILDKPIYVNIKVNRNERLSAKDWINEIEIEIETPRGKENKKVIPQFVILYFNNEQKKDKHLYEKLKSHLVHQRQINSQVITKKTLFMGAKGDMSKASKILLQINDKMGHPLYKVEKQHPFWTKNTIAIGSLSTSGGPKGAIASFVGTRNNDLTQSCSDFSKINKKQQIPKAIITSFISGWLKAYYKSEGKKLPDVLFIYRDGLNEKQVGKILEQEIKAIEETFEQVAQKAKVNGWKPKLVYINVNQKTGTRAYDQDKNGRLSNPLPGTIIGSQISKDGSYEFLMASAATTEGTCNMVQYKVAYDSSKQDIPHEALKIITYEQCYNYPNWAGSIRFPAPLQKAAKLAQFVSTHGVDKIDKDNPLKSLDYYI